MTVEQLEGSLLAHEEKLKRIQEEPLEQLLKTHASFKGFESEKSYKENGQWRGRGGRERGRSYTKYFNNEDKGHQSFRGRGRGQRGGRGRGAYQGKNVMRHENLKWSVITIIKWYITLGNVIVMLKRKLIMLTTTKMKMSQHCY